MSPSIIAQKGPARTRVRSSTRTPASGPLAFATESSFPGALRKALRDRAHALTGSARAAPEELRAIERAEVREVVDVANRLDGHPRADLEPLGLVAVADEPRAADQIDQRDVKRRAEALGRREQRRERDDLAAAHHRGRRHLDRMARTPACRRRGDEPALGTTRRREVLDHRDSRMVTQLLVPGPPIDWSRATLHFTWRRGTHQVSCQTHSTICASPVAASGWPRALSPPEGLIGRRPSSAVSPSRVAGPALPAGKRPTSSSEMSSNGANASWISATSTRSAPKPAILNAALAAACVARKLVRLSRCRSASASVPCPTPATRTVARSEVSTTAAAPSEIGQQWKRRSGSATMRLPSTISGVIASRKCASGLRAPFAWFLTGTWAISRSVTPRAIRARVTSAANAGMVVPYERSYGSSERPISSDTLGVGRCVIFSPPTTTTVSASPEAICAKPA